MVCICFPAETTVTTDQGVKRMDDLIPSDEVLTYSKGRNVQKWTQFFTWGHLEPERVAEFMVLKVRNGNELTISSDHLLFVVGENGKRVAKKAKDVCIGDKMYCLGQNRKLESETVLEIRSQSFTGVFAPFTMSGDFFANGFLVSCYANVDGVHLAQAHAALAPLRAWYRLRHQLGQDQKESSNPGIHGYARSLMKFLELLVPMPVVAVN